MNEAAINNIRAYNFNTYYINKLIKLSKYTNKKDMAKNMGLTENALNLKIGARTLIYINEGIEIANQLKMNILDVFCPSEQHMFDIMYDKSPIFKPKLYRDFNLNKKYLNKLMSNHNVVKKDLCDLWELKPVSIYDKLRGDTKITIKEGILFSELIEIDINDLFCPTNEQILKVISKEFRKRYKKNKDTLIIKNCNEVTEGFNINKIEHNKKYMKYLLSVNNKKAEDLKNLWNISLTQTYNKINNINPINLDEAFKLSEFLKLPLKTIFNPTKEQLNQANSYFKK